MTWHCAKCSMPFYVEEPPQKCTRCLSSDLREYISTGHSNQVSGESNKSGYEILDERDILQARVLHLEQLLDRIAMVFEDLKDR